MSLALVQILAQGPDIFLQHFFTYLNNWVMKVSIVASGRPVPTKEILVCQQEPFVLQEAPGLDTKAWCSELLGYLEESYEQEKMGDCPKEGKLDLYVAQYKAKETRAEHTKTQIRTSEGRVPYWEEQKPGPSVPWSQDRTFKRDSKVLVKVPLSESGSEETQHSFPRRGTLLSFKTLFLFVVPSSQTP
jgi:hypothetical protein